MTTEANAAPDVAADTATSEQIANTQPEVASPESNEVEQQPQEKHEGDDSDKSLKRLQRRVDRVTAARYQAEARAQQLEQQLRSVLEQQPRDEETPQIKPDDIERIAHQKARELVEAEQISKRSNAIKSELVKKVGSDGFFEVISTVTEEAGPLADERGRWTPLGEAIAESDDPAGLLVYLKDNPDTAAELQGLSAAAIGRRIARIEAQMKPQEPKPSKAPKPISPVKGSSAGSGEPDPKDTAAWIAWRNKQARRY